MNRLFQVLVLLCAALFIGAGVASADTLQFTLAGPVSATFDLPSSPTILMGNADPTFGFIIMPASVTVNGSVAPGDFLAFFNGAPGIDGGLEIFAPGPSVVAYAFGPQIYSGGEANPTFAPGSFTLTDGNAPVGTVPGTYTLTITDLTTVATPEPSVTILLAIGLVAVGLAVLRFKPNFGVRAS